MTGPEHYAEAERLLGIVSEAVAEPGDVPLNKQIVAEAQVHATLALAAATAMAAAETMDSRDFKAWDTVAGVP